MEDAVTLMAMAGAMGLSLALALGLGWSSMAWAFRLMPSRSQNAGPILRIGVPHPAFWLTRPEKKHVQANGGGN